MEVENTGQYIWTF